MLILASASPRRSLLLREIGVPFEVRPSNAHEPEPAPNDLQHPGAYVEKLARLKVEATPRTPQELVLGADTAVFIAGKILNKPRDTHQAREMLRFMRGQTHVVYTGVCLARGDQIEKAHAATRVSFGDFSDELLEDYLMTGEALDKAGAYGAQGKGALLVARIEGDYWNVVGLPLFLLNQLLPNFGVQISRAWQ